MEIKSTEITIRDLTNNFDDQGEQGVIGYDGELDIRPAYQREFVYNATQQRAVIDTVLKGYPLSVMYWVRNPNTPAEFEVLDGQQRTLSICNFITDKFTIDVDGMELLFTNLTEDEKNKILDYKLTVNICEGSERSKLEWFARINIAGVVLNNQELKNAVYTGEWLSDAKLHFSKSGCAATSISSDYLKGSPIRQELLETALEWIALSDKEKYGSIERYMSAHQHDEDCSELWQYFQDVINWSKKLFPTVRKDLKSINWGKMYAEFKDNTYNHNTLEKKYQEIINNPDFEGKNMRGVYMFLITDDAKHLQYRAFNQKQRQIAYDKQGGKCALTGEKLPLKEMEADHIIPFSKGGETTQENCQMLSMKANRSKSNK